MGRLSRLPKKESLTRLLLFAKLAVVYTQARTRFWRSKMGCTYAISKEPLPAVLYGTILLTRNVTLYCKTDVPTWLTKKFHFSRWCTSRCIERSPRVYRPSLDVISNCGFYIVDTRSWEVAHMIIIYSCLDESHGIQGVRQTNDHHEGFMLCDKTVCECCARLFVYEHVWFEFAPFLLLLWTNKKGCYVAPRETIFSHVIFFSLCSHTHPQTLPVVDNTPNQA